MAKLNLQEQTRSTRYGQSDEENFEDFVVKPSLKVSGRIVLLPLEQLVEYRRSGHCCYFQVQLYQETDLRKNRCQVVISK